MERFEKWIKPCLIVAGFFTLILINSALLFFILRPTDRAVVYFLATIITSLFLSAQFWLAGGILTAMSRSAKNGPKKPPEPEKKEDPFQTTIY